MMTIAAVDNEVGSPIRGTLEELRQLISRRYPDATYEVARGEDPSGIYLFAQANAGDMDEMMDVFVDRLLQLQIEDGLEVYVIPEPRRLDGTAPTPDVDAMAQDLRGRVDNGRDR